MLIDEITIALGSGPDGYRATFRNIEAYGVSNLTVTNVRWVFYVHVPNWQPKARVFAGVSRRCNGFWILHSMLISASECLIGSTGLHRPDDALACARENDNNNNHLINRVDYINSRPDIVAASEPVSSNSIISQAADDDLMLNRNRFNATTSDRKGY